MISTLRFEFKFVKTKNTFPNGRPKFAAPFGIYAATTFSIITLNPKGLFVTLSINDTQHNSF
jgi:hypothetical protein